VQKRTGWLVALGVLALLAFGLATMPAGIVAGPLGKAGIEAAGFNGSVWRGHATALVWRGAPMGDLDWTLSPLALLRARASGHARLLRADGGLQTDFDTSFAGGDIRLDGLELALPISALDGLPLGMPKGWRGRVSGRLDEVRLEQRWPTALRGTLDLDGLVAPPPRNAPIGSFRAVLPHPSPQPSLSVPKDPANLTARIVDKEGPYAVDAQLTLNRQRSFSLDGTLAPRGAVPQSMQRSLELLGPADASGRRQFSIGGSF
jgi:general secretion pathway protein N